jgi:hypothetical protein
MTPPVYGVDAAEPPTALARLQQVVGFYAAGDTPHVWTAAQVADMQSLGTRGVYAIFVPSQVDEWWAGNVRQYLDTLLRSSAVPLPTLCPAELDIEEHQAEAMGHANLFSIGSMWASCCWTFDPSNRRIPWVYGGESTQAAMPAGIRRHLAQWDFPAGEAPTFPPTAPPAGYAGHQYAGNISTPSGVVDLDVYAQGMRFATPDLSSTVVIGPRPGRPVGGVL